PTNTSHPSLHDALPISTSPFVPPLTIEAIYQPNISAEYIDTIYGGPGAVNLAARPRSGRGGEGLHRGGGGGGLDLGQDDHVGPRSEEHTSELQSPDHLV